MLVVSLITLWTFSVPGTYFLPLMILPYLWAGIVVVWLILALRIAGRALAAFRDRSVLAGVAIAVSTLLAVVLELPLQARWQLSQGPIEALVVQMTASNAPGSIEDRPVGLFDAERVESFDGGFRFLVKGTGFLNPYGFAYSPSGPPPDIGGEDYYEHFTGPWWFWEEDW